MILLRGYLFLLAIALAFTASGWWSKKPESVKRGLSLVVLLHVVLGALAAGWMAITALSLIIVAVGTDEVVRNYPLPRPVVGVAAVATFAGMVAWPWAIVAAVPVVLLLAAATFALPAERVRESWFGLAFSLGVVAVGAAAIARLAWDDPVPLLVLFVLLQLNDGIGLIAGRAFGRTRPFPTISPNKTVEGYIGGAVGVAVGLLLLATLIPAIPGASFVAFAVLFVLFVVLGSAGDLLLSALKRKIGIKDFGALLPGHGGVLDRFDKSLFVAPVLLSLWPVLLGG